MSCKHTSSQQLCDHITVLATHIRTVGNRPGSSGLAPFIARTEEILQELEEVVAQGSYLGHLLSQDTSLQDVQSSLESLLDESQVEITSQPLTDVTLQAAVPRASFIRSQIYQLAKDVSGMAHV